MLARSLWVVIVAALVCFAYSEVKFRQARTAFDRVVGPVEAMTEDEFTDQAYQELGME